MTKQRAVGFLTGFLWISSGVASSETTYAVKEKACSIELAMIKAPHAYLVAMVEHTEDPKCDVNYCLYRLAVNNVLSERVLAHLGPLRLIFDIHL
jgi:hypothetical protein